MRKNNTSRKKTYAMIIDYELNTLTVLANQASDYI